MSLTKSYFNVRQNKWYLTAQDAAEWMPGPCVVWEITGQCPNGAECTCAHLNRDELDVKNWHNGLGNYVEATLGARCKYVLKMIKSGAWSFMKGQINPNAPCLMELLQWLPKQKGGEIDVDVVQSFIAANKIVANVAAEEQRQEALAVWEKFLADCISLQTKNAELEEQIRYEQWRLTQMRVAAVKNYVAAVKRDVKPTIVDEVAIEAPEGLPELVKWDMYGHGKGRWGEIACEGDE
jgi:hypothetical protein